MKNILSIFLLFLAYSINAANEYTIKTVPNDHLSNAYDYVTNPDNIISVNAEEELNKLIQNISDSSSVEIAVVLLNSIGNEDIDNFATELFTTWGIGKKNDNGLLFLLVYDVREMVFRTGYGIEGVLPDAILSRVIRNNISPELKNGNFDKGILNGFNQVSYYLTNPDTIDEIMYSNNTQENFSSILKLYLLLSFIVFLLFLLYLITKLISKKDNYDKYKSMNGSAKTFLIICTIIFPIFMLIIAIAFPIIKKRLRNNKRTCSRCNHKMHKLNEQEEDKFLNKGQQTEELIKSIDYDVWLCDNCSNVEILSYNNKLSPYTLCPRCKSKTFILQNDRIISRATTRSNGTGEKSYICKNCGFTDKKRYIIPMIILSSGSRSGGGSFGGGSFGGGGSWGGGRTGGGGARGGW